MNQYQRIYNILLETSPKGTGEIVGRVLRKKMGPFQPVSTETLTEPETKAQRASTPAAKFKSKQNYKHPQWRAQKIKSRFVDRAYNKAKAARDAEEIEGTGPLARGGGKMAKAFYDRDAEREAQAEFDKGKEKGQRTPVTPDPTGDTWVIDKRGGKTRSYWKYGDKKPGV